MVPSPVSAVSDGALRVDIVIQGIGFVSCALFRYCAAAPDAHAGRLPENQRDAHENAFAGFQTEVIFSALLVADVAAVFLLASIVRIIQARPLVTRDVVGWGSRMIG